MWVFLAPVVQPLNHLHLLAISNPNTKSHIFDSLPKKIQSAIVTYRELAEVSPDIVIRFAIARFLELEFIPMPDSHSYTESRSILNDLPTSLQTEIEKYAAEDNIPPEFVVELAIGNSSVNIKQQCLPHLPN
ncbi:hypothetical protein [Limnofasciculus baicalensis]|uniref:Uncharacterized protein n=1 Tax=Limnofasciculus baicalensis BBK-W-15 TaxID=2699891 RepID=A0AAE3GMA6_9CYAN|nr:hypothetical protein [Limnofasciculus baicalensis]MCP2727225.1 hypothetical protein [Limnofasciculus baicalensis BBK-W-15]